ncbi:MAG TPA: flagellar motor protein MotB [Vicinamibacterales bacterium]|nr:flagellar motor protein MotB [Vicinamibacterales bacterium]
MRSGTHPPGGGQDRWLLSYADFVTLLLAFFVTMYGISTVDANKIGPAASSLRVAFEGDGRQEGPLPVKDGGAVVPQSPPAKPLDAVRSTLNVALEDALRANRIEMIQDPRGLVVSLPESGTFAPASTDVTDGARDLIARVASAVQPFGHAMRIEGHTDDVPIHTPAFRSNWELSTARASAVIAFLIETVAFDPARLSAAGYGEFHPRALNDSPDNRARNRRVDIVILEEMP